jgi:hypothetical protein
MLPETWWMAGVGVNATVGVEVGGRVGVSSGGGVGVSGNCGSGRVAVAVAAGGVCDGVAVEVGGVALGVASRGVAGGAHAPNHRKAISRPVTEIKIE